MAALMEYSTLLLAAIAVVLIVVFLSGIRISQE